MGKRREGVGGRRAGSEALRGKWRVGEPLPFGGKSLLSADCLCCRLSMIFLAEADFALIYKTG